MWVDVDPVWQETLKLAWGAFCTGTVPVGCVICNEQGEIVARGQNAIANQASSSVLAGTDLAHAETIALSQLLKIEHPKIREYTLYTSLEPCPMCFGASVMMGIRQIWYAARDAIAGSAQLRTATSYLRSKKITIELMDSDLEVFQIALLTAFELGRKHPRQTDLINAWRDDCPKGVATGSDLFEQGYFIKAVAENYSVGRVFNKVL